MGTKVKDIITKALKNVPLASDADAKVIAKKLGITEAKLRKLMAGELEITVELAIALTAVQKEFGAKKPVTERAFLDAQTEDVLAAAGVKPEARPATEAKPAHVPSSQSPMYGQPKAERTASL